MCSTPITADGVTFSCRVCNECIATRRHGWVARAMAEKTQHPHTICLALTYDDTTQENRDSAAMFCYADVRAFMKRLASACRYIDPTAIVRFICAGEQGSRHGRCHWHLILYSTLDLTTVGQFSVRGNIVTDREEMVTVGKRKIRLNWSLWGKGFVTVQEPDQGGMNYVLSYCLKDQFTVEKSRGTMRECSVESFATGLFRMSKRPAIGEAYLMRKLEGLLASGSVLPSLKISIPFFQGYWHPTGLFREKLLWGLVALNQRVLWATGANAPQWPSLVASVQDNESDKEILLGKEIESESEWLKTHSLNNREVTSAHHARGFAFICGAQLPCADCLNYLSESELASVGVQTLYHEGFSYHCSLDGFAPIESRQRTSGGGSNPFCRKRGSLASQLVFPASDRRLKVRSS